MSELSMERIEAALETQWLGREVMFHPRIGSTNDEVERLAKDGAPEGIIVVADYQVMGRGRLNREWWSPPGSNLLLSILLRPTFLAPQQAQRLTMLCSLAVCDAIAAVAALRADVKWPNDLLIGGKKVCGLLSELGIVGARLDYVVVGIGLNVNANFEGAEVPPLMVAATSLKNEIGREVSRLAVLSALLKRMEARYQRLRAGAMPHKEWGSRLTTVGQPVRVTMADRTLTGWATGVDADGALLVRRDDGEIERVLAGDVTLRDGPVSKR